MEYKQLKKFDKYFASLSKTQKSKSLESAIEKALNFKKNQEKENPDKVSNTAQSAQINKDLNSSPTESTKVVKKTFLTIVEEEKDKESQDNKMQLSTLKKRKPLVESTKSKQVAKNSKTSAADTSESINMKAATKTNKQTTPKTAKFVAMTSSSTDHCNMSTFEHHMRVADVPKIANSLAEELYVIRNKLNGKSVEERVKLYRQLILFCQVCASKSDEDIKQMVIQRLGSYLTVIYYLISDINDKQCSNYTPAQQAVCQFINSIKAKTLNYVN